MWIAAKEMVYWTHESFHLLENVSGINFSNSHEWFSALSAQCLCYSLAIQLFLNANLHLSCEIAEFIRRVFVR